jgi:hypothetical protein
MLSTRLLSLGFVITVASSTFSLSAQQITTPAIGSATRRAILDAVRSHLGIESKFQVQYLKVTGRWSYLRAGEIVEDDGSTQETDLSIAALLERPAGGTWKVVELWSLPGEDYFSFAEFSRIVREREARDQIPAALFPPEL